MGFSPREVDKMYAWEILHIAETYRVTNGGKKGMSDADFEIAAEALDNAPDVLPADAV